MNSSNGCVTCITHVRNARERRSETSLLDPEGGHRESATGDRRFSSQRRSGHRGGGASLAASLREHLELAFLFRELATLVLDVPLVSESLDDLRWKGAHRVAFEAVAEKLAAPDLIGRVPKWAD